MIDSIAVIAGEENNSIIELILRIYQLFTNMKNHIESHYIKHESIRKLLEKM